MMRSVRVLGLSCLLVIAACHRGAVKSPKPVRPIDTLRERAAAEPKNAALWAELAEYEYLADGGEPARARSAIGRAEKLGASPLRVGLLKAELHVLEGHPQLALDAYLDLVNKSLTSQDPLRDAIAEAALSSVFDMNDATPDYRARVDAAFAKLLPHVDKLGLNVAHLLRMRELGRSFTRGDLAAVDEHAKAAGCVRKAEVIGAFGPRELLGFDQTLPGESQGALDKEYDLGPGRGKAKTRSLDTRRCLLSLGHGARDPRPGTSLARAEIEIKNGGSYALRLESPNSVVLWLDGKEVVRRDQRAQASSGVRFVPLELSAGRHELRIKVTSRHPNPALSLAFVPAKAERVHATSAPLPNEPFSRFLAAKLLLNRGDTVSAREVLRAKNGSDPTAAILVLSAATALADPLRPPELRRDHARDLLSKAHVQNPDAWYPHVGLAGLSAAEGQLKEAIDLLRAAAERFPDVVAIRTSLIDKLRERGFVEEADRTVDALEKRMPEACAVVAIALSTAKSRARMAKVRELTDRAMRCDATSTARFQLLSAERRYDDAARELERLRALGDVLDPVERIEAELELAQLVGDEAREKELRIEREKAWPDRPGPVLDRVDLVLSGGDLTGARKSLISAINSYPEELYELRRVAEGLGEPGLFDMWRKDGDQVIAAFQASARKYDQPQVLVLDYTVVRVFEDGSSADLTHNIFRVQSEEAVDENGEYSPPDGARLLKLHVVKADGKKLEPDVIGGKASLSLPNLEPSDYVEVEFVRGQGPSGGFPGGYLGDRFYFKSFEVPFDHSELLVVLPASFEPVIDPRGPAPAAITETKDGLKVLRFSATESRPLVAEPSSVTSREFLPSINIGVNVDWQAYLDSLRDLLADKDPYDPAAAEIVAALLKGAGETPSARAAALFRWVTSEIEPTDDIFGIAPQMLAARTGSRDRVLAYMLRLAGIETELGLLRGAEADHSKALVPDPETFGYMTLRVKTEKGYVWLHTSQRDAPFGFLPAHLRDEEVLLLKPKLERMRTPAFDPNVVDLREIDANVTLAPSGSALVHVRETLRGSSAIGWRNDLDEVPAAEIEARFEESYVSRLVPGARLTALSIGARNEPEKPLVLDYQFEVASLGRREGSTQYVPPMFASSLSGSLARTANRTVTELVGASVASDIRTRYLLPKGAAVTALPASLERKHDKITFRASARREGSDVLVSRSLRLPVSRIEPSSYPAFADFCRAVDLAEGTELSVKMP